MKGITLRAFCVCLFLLLCVSSTVVIASAKVNINKATAVELITLKGIGEKTAASIVEYRNLHGEFKTISDLQNVKGIGPKSLAKLAGLIIVSDEETPK